MKRTEFRKGMLVLAGAALVLAAGLGGEFPFGQGMAQAQQAQSGRTAGATRGGNQGIAPGGASGVSSPAPGGGPPSLGEPQQSAVSQPSQNTSPFYLGGSAAPDEPPAPATGVTMTQGVVPHDSVCEDLRGGFRNPSQRLTGANGERLDAASAMVHPEGEAREVQVLRLLLANFQEEMLKRSPDLILAGTYLGVAAELPVTEEMVAQLAGSLCVPVRKEQAASIAAVAEVQRKKADRERAR